MNQGRPRDTDITERVLDLARAQLLDGGLAALNYDALAIGAGTSRTAIYRRWPNRTDLARDVVEASTLPSVRPETGSVVEDLVQHSMQNVLNQQMVLRGRDVSSLWLTILSPEILDHFMKRIGRRRRDLGREIIAAGISREELPADTDQELLLDTLAGLALFRSVVARRPATEHEIRTVVRSLCEAPPRRDDGRPAGAATTT